MDFLARAPKISNHLAGLIIFFAWYIAATTTTLLVNGLYERILSKTFWVFVAVLLFMTIIFAVSRRIKRTDLIDAAWGPAFVVAALSSLLLNETMQVAGLNVQLLVTMLVVIWATRLSYTIVRRLRTRPEDKRYVDLRSKWKGNEACNTYLRIFVVQALLATAISIAIIHVNLSVSVPLGPVAYIGLAVWIIGFGFETIGDLQLKRFLSDSKNKGKLMSQGLWKYTRHPNYFGEATMWWGIFIIALSTPYGWVGVLTPVLITYLLLFVSGVPMTEKAFERKPGWAKYKAQTSKFLPLPPKKG
jgi:steroid 5-alpha reductase family enzyme